MEAPSVPVISADDINAEHDMAISAVNDAVEHGRRCGKMLREKKVEMNRHFLQWVRDNCRFGIRQAQRYMNGSLPNATLMSHVRDSDSHLHLADGTAVEPTGRTGKPTSVTKRQLREEAKTARAAEEAEKDNRIAQCLRNGMGVRETIKSNNSSTTRVQHIYATVIVPELLSSNWEQSIRESRCKEIAIARRWNICAAAASVDGKRKDVIAWAETRFSVTRNLMSAATTVLKHGSPELIAKCEDGSVPLSTAGRIAKKFPKETQIYKLNGFAKRKGGEDQARELLDRLSRMLDEQSIWERDHGSEWKQLESLARSAGEADRAEIVKTARAMMSWLELIAEIFGDSQWDTSRQTNGQPITSDKTQLSLNTATASP